MDSESLRKEGNDKFKAGQYEEAVELYGRVLEIEPESHITYSNRSLSYCKLGQYELALSDAERCVELSSTWGKGHLRKACALNLLQRYREASQAALSGFILCSSEPIAKDIVKQWLEAKMSIMRLQFAPVFEKLGEIIPDYSVIFCPEYCDIIVETVVLRLSDANGMSHDKMVSLVNGANKIANDVLTQFHQPLSTCFQDWADAAVNQFDSLPSIDLDRELETLSQRTKALVTWLKQELHPALKQVIYPCVVLAISTILVRCNLFCQAYTGHVTGEYLGHSCLGLFDSGCFDDPIYAALHLAALNILPSIYRMRGTPLTEKEVELTRVICHKMEFLLEKLPTSYKHYEFITEHYQHAIKVSWEICAKVLSDFTGSYDFKGSLSELEIVFLDIEKNPGAAMDMATKYLTDISQKEKNFDFIDAENMLYLTGIFAKLKMLDSAKTVFKCGENMIFSLIGSVVRNGVLSLDELPGTVTNSREFVLSGAIFLNDEYPVDSVDAFIRWKSLFTELRAVLIQIGLRDAYRSAFIALEKCATDPALEKCATDPALKNKPPIQKFKAIESQVLQKSIIPVLSVLHQQDSQKIRAVMNDTDVILDYTFNIYNPEYRDPPESQACGILITAQEEPFLFKISHKNVYELLRQFPKAVYELWRKYSLQHPVLKELSNILFPPNVCEYILKPGGVKRLFICPDVDLLCFPIDQLPITDTHGTTKPLHEWFSVSFLSSPRELIRKPTVLHLQSILSSKSEAGKDGSDHEGLSSESTGKQLDDELPAQYETDKQNDQNSSSKSTDTQENCSENNTELVINKPSLVQSNKHKCYIVANPKYKHELPPETQASLGAFNFKSLFSSLDSLLGLSESIEDEIDELTSSQKEAENIQLLLSMNDKLEVSEPILGSEATISRILDIQSPFILHLATHGYSSKQVSVRYKGNFWTDNSSGILLAGASTFRNKRYDNIDPKAGTGHMNAIAACGMQLDNTRLVFVSTCNSSVGSRPTQEMPNSFTQAVQAAGAETVIATLWVVNDGETAEFVTYFYDHIANNPHCRPSEAISYAKQAMKAAGKSMYFWGAFVCNGLDNPL